MNKLSVFVVGLALGALFVVLLPRQPAPEDGELRAARAQIVTLSHRADSLKNRLAALRPQLPIESVAVEIATLHTDTIITQVLDSTSVAPVRAALAEERQARNVEKAALLLVIHTQDSLLSMQDTLILRLQSLNRNLELALTAARRHSLLSKVGLVAATAGGVIVGCRLSPSC